MPCIFSVPGPLQKQVIISGPATLAYVFFLKAEGEIKSNFEEKSKTGVNSFSILEILVN